MQLHSFAIQILEKNERKKRNYNLNYFVTKHVMPNCVLGRATYLFYRDISSIIEMKFQSEIDKVYSIFIKKIVISYYCSLHLC